MHRNKMLQLTLFHKLLWFVSFDVLIIMNFSCYLRFGNVLLENCWALIDMNIHNTYLGTNLMCRSVEHFVSNGIVVAM